MLARAPTPPVFGTCGPSLAIALLLTLTVQVPAAPTAPAAETSLDALAQERTQGGGPVPIPRGSASDLEGSVEVVTNDSRGANNTLLTSTFLLPTPSAGGMGSVQTWLIEPLNVQEDVGVGVWLNVSQGTLTLQEVWATWEGSVISNSGWDDPITATPGTPVQLGIEHDSGDDWNLSVDGPSLPSSQGAVVDLGVERADDGLSPSTTGIPWTEPTLRVVSWGPFPFALLEWTRAFTVGSLSSSIQPGDGFAVSSGDTWGVAGQDQGTAAAPDQIIESPSEPAVGNGTMLWGIGDVNFPPVAAWTSVGTTAFSTVGSSVEMVVPPARSSLGTYVGICQELLEPLDNGVWITVGACWADGAGVRAYVAVTQADGAAYQEPTPVPLPSSGQTVQIEVRAIGGGLWQASLDGEVLANAQGNSSIAGGADLSNSSQGPYGALRGFPDTALPSVLYYPEAVGVFRSSGQQVPETTEEGLVAPSDARVPALIQGELQNSSLAPGAIEVLPGQPPLPFGSPLWNSSVAGSGPSAASGSLAAEAPIFALLIAATSVLIVQRTPPRPRGGLGGAARPSDP